MTFELGNPGPALPELADYKEVIGSSPAATTPSSHQRVPRKMAKITTPVTQLFGIKHPILLAGELHHCPSFADIILTSSRRLRDERRFVIAVGLKVTP